MCQESPGTTLISGPLLRFSRDCLGERACDYDVEAPYIEHAFNRGRIYSILFERLDEMLDTQKVRLWQYPPVSELQIGSNPIPWGSQVASPPGMPLAYQSFGFVLNRLDLDLCHFVKKLVHEFSLFVGRAFTSYE